MNLIEVFENKAFQDVGTFNAIFKTTPILGYPSNAEVEIKELTSGGERKILVNGEVLYLDLTQKNIQEPVKRVRKVQTLKTRKLERRQKSLLPDIYRRLSASEFMIYCAIKELGEVHGIAELERNIALNRKTISQSLPRLISLKLVKTERANGNGDTFLRIMIDNSETK